MKIAPVEISILDAKKYGDVAFLVDRKDFIEDITKLRHKWKHYHILPLTNPQKSWSTFPWVFDKEQLKRYMDAVIDTELSTQDLNTYRKMTTSEQKKYIKRCRDAQRSVPAIDFRYDIAAIRKKYKRSPNFDRIIAQVTLYNTVKDEDYITCEVQLIKSGVESLLHLDDEKVAIVVYPLATAKDIKTIADEKLPQIMNEYQQQFIGASVFNPDTVSNVKRDREWYWLHENGLSHSDVWKTALQKGDKLSKDAVIKAVVQYRDRVNTEL